MSADDVWQLKILIRLSLSSSEITSPVDVKPVYLLAPRHAYLPALAQQCLGFFQHVLLSLPGQSHATPWFEYHGLPLNWTQPLGVLHDLLTPTSTTSAASSAGQSAGPTSTETPSCSFSSPSIPWSLTVHYQNMPAALQNNWQNAGAAKDHYFSSLKEAGYCCRGSDGCGAVMRLPGSAQDDLWSAVNNGAGQAVQTVLNQLRMQPTQKAGGGQCYVPVRIYMRKHTGGSSKEGLIDVWSNTYSSSRPVDLAQPDGSATLLAHVLHMVMPQQFPAPFVAAGEVAQPSADGRQQEPQQSAVAAQLTASSGTSSSPATGMLNAADAVSETSAADPLRVPNRPIATCSEAVTAEGLPGSAATATASPATAEVSYQQQTTSAVNPAKAATIVLPAANHVLVSGWPTQGISVAVCGVQPDWCTPLGWLHSHFRAADGFLYIVVHVLGKD